MITMKENIFNLKEEEFLTNIKGFFETRSAKEYLLFIDYWMELILSGKTRKKWTNPSTLYFLYGKINDLFDGCNKLLEDETALKALELSAIVDKNTLLAEKNTLIFYPYYLKAKEQLHPFKALRYIFSKKDINSIKAHFEEWFADSLHKSYNGGSIDYIIPLYSHTKKLIEACWLIHERVLSKNSFKMPVHFDPVLNYALTEPFLFNQENSEDPFLMIEDFFNFTSLSGYKSELQKWYITSITEELATKKPNDLLFFYHQYQSLLQAGYLIAAKNLSYTPKIDKSNDRTMGKWLLDVRDLSVKNGEIDLSDEAPQVLTMAERANPLAYCKETLSLSNVSQLRFGLSEWLYASFSEQCSIHTLDAQYIFEQYLTLQKLTEAFHLIITTQSTVDLSTLNPINHEA